MSNSDDTLENINRTDNSSTTLLKFVSQSSQFSRRNSFTKIMNGGVKVNGQICREPSYLLVPKDYIELDGTHLSVNRPIYIILNKPRGYVCSNADEHAPKKAIDLISNNVKERLFSVGRLDKNSEGLIIFTNDGEFANHIMHPRNAINKVYIVSLDINLSLEQIQKIKDGIIDRGETLNIVKIEHISGSKYSLTLKEGKNREIRRIFEHFSIKVKSLRRVSIGNLKLKGLPIGTWRHLTDLELNLLKREKIKNMI